MNEFLTSFTPLCRTKKGREAIKNYGLKPYIDGSCRREPDFENVYPAITGLCRPGFVKRLSSKDLVIYITNKKEIGSHNLVAILQVIEIVDSHTEAEKWYKNMNVPMPNNIMVKGNKPMPLDMTHQKTKCVKCVNGAKTIEEWDAEYVKRAQDSPKVAICKIWENYLFLDQPPEITKEDFLKVFKRIPGTQTPPKLKENEPDRFLELLKTKRGK